MATMAQFSRNIRKRGSQIENSSKRVVQAVSKRTLKALVNGTKVDKGVARSNWRVGIGAPTRAVIKAYSPYPKGSQAGGQGMSERANASAAISAGNARINSLPAGPLRTSVYITNSIPYANNAFPPGMVATAVQEGRLEILGFRVFVN